MTFSIYSLLRYLEDFYYTLLGIYRPFKSSINIEDIRTPLIKLSIKDVKIVFTCDFLPDKYSWSGVPFEDSPHFRFAYEYLNKSNFNPQDTLYYHLAMRGHLPYPCYGKEQANYLCKRFIQLIESIRQEGYDIDKVNKYGAITFAIYGDEGLMVLNGKHRLAALLALGIYEFPGVICPSYLIEKLFQNVVARSRPRIFYRKSFGALKKVLRTVEGRINESSANNKNFL